MAYGHPWQSLRGYADLLTEVGHILRSRRAVDRGFASSAFDAMLSTELGGSPVLALVRQTLGRLFS